MSVIEGFCQCLDQQFHISPDLGNSDLVHFVNANNESCLDVELIVCSMGEFLSF